jgi:hypothetical protein
LGWFCPCMLYAQLKQRVDYLNMYARPDPSLGGSGIDLNCMIWCGLHLTTGCGYALQVRRIKLPYKLSDSDVIPGHYERPNTQPLHDRRQRSSRFLHGLFLYSLPVDPGVPRTRIGGESLDSGTPMTRARSCFYEHH